MAVLDSSPHVSVIVRANYSSLATHIGIRGRAGFQNLAPTASIHRTIVVLGTRMVGASRGWSVNFAYSLHEAQNPGNSGCAGRSYSTRTVRHVRTYLGFDAPATRPSKRISSHDFVEAPCRELLPDA